MHAVDQLFARLSSTEPLPPGVVSTRGRIQGLAFFPGGYGLWKEEGVTARPEMPFGGVMILGHNFDSEAGFRLSLERGYERRTAPTWRNLLRFLRDVDIPPLSCFFTNFFMGLVERKSNRGKFPGASDAKFTSRCRDFFLEQVSIQRPRLILTLGARVPGLISEAGADLLAWRGVKSFRSLDEAGLAYLPAVSFEGVPGFRASVVALTHPSYRPRNVSRRRYSSLAGDAAEQKMVEEALERIRGG